MVLHFGFSVTSPYCEQRLEFGSYFRLEIPSVRGVQELWVKHRALQKGISLAAIQKILGHDRLTTTAIYLNLTETHILQEFEQKW